MAKERVNWTIDAELVEALREIARQTGKKLSVLVENALRQTYQDPLLSADAQARYHHKEFIRWHDELERLRELRKAEGQEVKTTWKTPD